MLRFNQKIQTVVTWPMANLFFGVVGLAIVWLATHNWIAILGCFISAIHLQLTIEK